MSPQAIQFVNACGIDSPDESGAHEDILDLGCCFAGL